MNSRAGDGRLHPATHVTDQCPKNRALTSPIGRYRVAGWWARREVPSGLSLMELVHDWPECTGTWYQEVHGTAVYWRCDRCRVVYYPAEDVTRAALTENRMGTTLRTLTRAGDDLLQDDGRRSARTLSDRAVPPHARMHGGVAAGSDRALALHGVWRALLPRAGRACGCAPGKLDGCGPDETHEGGKEDAGRFRPPGGLGGLTHTGNASTPGEENDG